MAGKETHFDSSRREAGEKCAVFGIINPSNPEVSRMTAQGLFVLQHRGQEASGIASSDGEKIWDHRRTGLVSQVYDDRDSDFSFSKLPGHIATGHNRYGTFTRRSADCHLQPVIDDQNKRVTFAHNGNLPDTDKLEEFLDDKGISTSPLNDSEMMHAAILHFVNKGSSLEEAVQNAIPHFTGAFSFLAMDNQNIVAARDNRGIRPFSIGSMNGGWVFSSETCAIDTIGAKYIRDVNPGEIVVANENGLFSRPYDKGRQKLDVFEFVYFSRPDSILLGQSVYEVRKRFGEELAKEHPLDADMVIPIPESSTPAALGYSQITGIPLEAALVKNKYIGRTFITNESHRGADIAMKYNPISSVLRNKRAIIIDDSIVRGLTSIWLVKLLREAGVRELYMLIPSPPVRYPDFYGIDTPKQKDLIAYNKTVEEICRLIGADKLYFLSVEGMIKATRLPKSMLSTSCFTGDYPIDIGRRREEIVYQKI
ncbi:MAG: amidophosphoribosyltransferase [Patescibacteria group bacterium]